jgi:hypothetical protein
MEAISMVNRGVSENHAFCWASLKLLDENELMKNMIVELKKTCKVSNEIIDTQKELIENLKIGIR